MPSSFLLVATGLGTLAVPDPLNPVGNGGGLKEGLRPVGALYSLFTLFFRL